MLDDKEFSAVKTLVKAEENHVKNMIIE